MRDQYIVPFVNATKRLFASMMDSEVVDQPPVILDRKAGDHSHEISALIGIVGDVPGTVGLSFSRETALDAVKKFIGVRLEEIDNDVIDAVGEMINIIAGNAKAGIHEAQLAISLPSVVVGHNHQIKWPGSLPVVSVLFTSPLGDFELNLSLKGIEGD